MKNIPVTFLFDYREVSDTLRSYIWHEFADNGARHIVLDNSLINRILSAPHLTQVLTEEIAAAGMTFVDAHAPFGVFADMLNCADDSRRRLMLSRQKAVIEITADMGVDTLTLHTGVCCTPEEWAIPREKHRERIAAALDQLLPVAERLGVTLCLENGWHMVNHPDMLLEIRRQFQSESLGFCYDAGHANLMDRSKTSAEGTVLRAWSGGGYTLDTIPWDDRILEKMLPHVVNCHLHDNNGVMDQHRNIGIGNIDWKHIVSLLKQAPRLRCIQSEVSPLRGPDSIRSICRAFADLLGGLN